jgi:pimeloyl-ACP methyl ester carboxylesterase
MPADTRGSPTVDPAVTGPVHQGTATLADGRRLGWSAWGPEDGAPVVFCSGAAMGSSLGFGASVLEPLGVRLVAVDRPGIGRSDPAPGRTLASWAEDVGGLVDALGLAEPRVVGFSQGAPFALACGAAGVARAVALVSGQDELAHPATAARLDAEVAALVQAVADEPDQVEAAFARSADADTMWQLVLTTSSALDRRRYTSSAFATAYRHALDEGFAQGGAGYARDFVLALDRWPFDVGQVTVPVDLWYGGLDASTVHSPDFGAELTHRLPVSRRHLVADAGSALLWTHADRILKALLEH